MKNNLDFKEGDFIIKIILLDNYKILFNIGKIRREMIRKGEEYVILSMMSFLEEECCKYKYVSKNDDIIICKKKDIELELFENISVSHKIEIDSFLLKIKDDNNKIYDNLLGFILSKNENEIEFEIFRYIRKIFNLGETFDLIEEFWTEK